jgi:hypothetical protein
MLIFLAVTLYELVALNSSVRFGEGVRSGNMFLKLKRGQVSEGFFASRDLEAFGVCLAFIGRTMGLNDEMMSTHNNLSGNLLGYRADMSNCLRMKFMACECQDGDCFSNGVNVGSEGDLSSANLGDEFYFNYFNYPHSHRR